MTCFRFAFHSATASHLDEDAGLPALVGTTSGDNHWVFADRHRCSVFLAEVPNYSVVTVCATPRKMMAMEEDAEALDRLRDNILDTFPPGEKRDSWLAWLKELASVSLCPQWPDWHRTYH